MQKGIFISATSTGVGKTVLSALLAYRLAKAGFKVAYYKPVQTGALTGPKGHLYSNDCSFLRQVLQKYPDCATTYSYLFKKPASPHYAASLEKITINMEKIKNDYQQLTAVYDFVITEGAGGLVVPLNNTGILMSDLPGYLSMNMLLLGSAGLGTINHIGLSYHYLMSKGINLKAIILLHSDEVPNDIEADNVITLKKMLRYNAIYLIPAVKNVDTENDQIGDLVYKSAFLPEQNEIERWFDYE